MAIINMAAIEDKCRAWSNTSVGKQRMNASVRKKQRDGARETAAGGELLTIDRMTELANELIDQLRFTAASYGLPSSVMSHFNSLTYHIEDNKDGTYTFNIFFDDDLSRDSLMKRDGTRTGDGIDNIIALLNNGYVASDYVYGYWSSNTAGTRYIRSVQSRPSLNFMQGTVEEFLKHYSGRYNIRAELSDDYNGGLFDGSFNAGDRLMGR